jgi:hypothetical protein
MGHSERWRIDDQSFHPEQIQIDLPRPPAWATNPTEHELYLEKQGHELRRRTPVREENRRVQELVLGWPPDRNCFVDARSRLDRNCSADLPAGSSQRFEAVAYVTAQTDDRTAPQKGTGLRSRGHARGSAGLQVQRRPPLRPPVEPPPVCEPPPPLGAGAAPPREALFGTTLGAEYERYAPPGTPAAAWPP